jgi:hypothetical protein
MRLLGQDGGIGMGGDCSTAAGQVWDFSKLLEIIIDRPAKDVWPYLFRKKNDVWSRTAYTTVAGEPGKVGEIYEMPFQGGQLAFQAIKLNPEKQQVLKITFRGNEKSERKLVGYDLFTLSEAAGRTTVVFQQAIELVVDPKENLELLTAKHDKFLTEIFQDLKRMVEGTPLSIAADATWWRK